MNSRKIAYGLVALLVLFGAGCGDDEPQQAETKPAQAERQQPAAQAEGKPAQAKEGRQPQQEAEPERTEAEAEPERAEAEPVQANGQPMSIKEAWEGMVRKGVEQSRDGKVPDSLPFALMRERPVAMPVALRQASMTTLGAPGPLRLRFDEAWRASTGLGFDIWVVRGKGVLCVFHGTTAAAACNTTAAVARRGQQLGTVRPGPSPTSPPEEHLLVGLAPDWAKAVELRVGEASKTVPVVENVYAARAKDKVEVERLIR